MSKYVFKDISIFFKSSCCNKTTGIVETLGETMPRSPDTLVKILLVDYYEFTTTFDLSKLHYDRNCHDLNDILYKFYKETITKFIKKYIDKKQTYYMVYSMPEYTKAGLLHFHTINYFDTGNEYYSAKLRLYSSRKFGNTLGKKVYDFNNYITYISKEYKSTNILLPIYIGKSPKASAVGKNKKSE